ncbi:MAG: type II toxin-antitoxin system HicB family antitoxin [Erysipelotrichaceae bacterium]|nr:type II toxin-antitoxin system HicB family antitoxin [Erysipelotrichaceae bacterium]
MSKLYYPAVFHVSEDVGGYWVEFPDLPGCFSQGDTIEESLEHSKEALGLYLDQSEDFFQTEFQQPSSFQKIMNQYKDEIIMLVEYDAKKYARKYKTKAVKKTLTIPQWLDEEASAHHLNFSRILKDALIAKLETIQKDHL